MNKPNDLIELIKELTEEPAIGHVRLTSKTSQAIIRTSDENDDEQSIILTDGECTMLLASPSRVDQFYDALGCPSDASIELHGLELDAEVLTTLEKLFVAVDEM